jgi:hypothetical protein
MIFGLTHDFITGGGSDMQGFDVFGRWLVILGLVIAVIGGIIWLVGRVPGLKQLPGTITINLAGVTCVFPLLGSILLSILLTVVLNLVARLLKH